MVITVDFDQVCAECAKTGATDNGICLRCVLRAFDATPMKSWQGKAVQARMQKMTERVAKRAQRR